MPFRRSRSRVVRSFGSLGPVVAALTLAACSTEAPAPSASSAAPPPGSAAAPPAAGPVDPMQRFADNSLAHVRAHAGAFGMARGGADVTLTRIVLDRPLGLAH